MRKSLLKLKDDEVDMLINCLVEDVTYKLMLSEKLLLEYRNDSCEDFIEKIKNSHATVMNYYMTIAKLLNNIPIIDSQASKNFIENKSKIFMAIDAAMSATQNIFDEISKS